MNIKDIPAGELVRISERSMVAGYSLGFDTGGRIVIWKIRFADGRLVTFYLAPAVAVHITKSLRRAARGHRWPDSEDWPLDAPTVSSADWNTPVNAANTVAAARVDGFKDTAVIALGVGKDLLQTMRLSPAHAVQIAALHWEQIRNGNLRDIASETPPSQSRH